MPHFDRMDVMSPIRRVELQARNEYVEALIAKTGSVRQAAKALGMDRGNFQALRRKTRILTEPAPKSTR